MKGRPLNVRQKWVSSLCMRNANRHVSQWKIAMHILGEHMKEKLTEQWQNEAMIWGMLKRYKVYIPQ
jgi:hypothetical protein